MIKNKQLNSKAVTLTELMVVVVILAIFGGIGFSLYFKATEKAIQAEAITNLGSLWAAQKRYLQETDQLFSFAFGEDVPAVAQEYWNKPSEYYWQYESQPDSGGGGGPATIIVGNAMRTGNKNPFQTYYIWVDLLGCVHCTGP